jgi:hypothetical protein
MKTLDDVLNDMGLRLHQTYKRDDETVVQITRGDGTGRDLWCVYVDKPGFGFTPDEWAAHANCGGHCGTEVMSWTSLDAITAQAVLQFVFSGEPLKLLVEVTK